MTTETGDIATFRRAERERLIAARLAVPVAEREAAGRSVAVALDGMVAAGSTVSVYWPFRGELDLRQWMASAAGRGIRVALPVVIAKGAPLVFRPWSPGCAMTRGVWNIPIPDTAETVAPDVVLAPLVGVDTEGYRLGYGGGFFDRTLAAANPRPLAIGVGHPVARIDTIYPQRWDIPMDRIVLGDAAGGPATCSAPKRRPAPR
jgi:5-formyltetrahydrofolate cyclo-ligase